MESLVKLCPSKLEIISENKVGADIEITNEI